MSGARRAAEGLTGLLAGVQAGTLEVICFNAVRGTFKATITL